MSGHDFQAVLLAAGLMAKDQGYRDLSFVLRRLAEDPLILATKIKQDITCTRQGTYLDSPKTTFATFALFSFSLFIYNMTQF